MKLKLAANTVGSGIALVLLLTGATATQRPFTGGGSNGNMWIQMPDESRTYYLLGASEAIATFPCCKGSSESESHEFKRLQYPDGLSAREVEAALDTFYSKEVNRVIPIAWALEVIAQKTKHGFSWEQMDTIINSFRKTAEEIATQESIPSHR